MEDTITITMTSASNFSASGAYYGSMGTGSVSADFSPVNPDTGQPYFTLAADGWGGTWQAGDTIVCDIHPSAIPVLMCQEIPEESESESNNMLPLGAYTE
jgi:hypothetical protein